MINDLEFFTRYVHYLYLRYTWQTFLNFTSITRMNLYCYMHLVFNSVIDEQLDYQQRTSKFETNSAISYIMYKGQYVLSVWNFIVEQGDSFITTVTTAQCLKYEVRSFLLVEIILSNAYKKKFVI